jgi:hypothetical protein
MTITPLKPRVRDAIIQSLRAGVVPRVGQQHIQVGRAAELKALVADIDRVADGGAGVRFVVGAYGSGKTFFLNLVRAIALEKKLVTVHADLTPDRRLHASGGQARSLYRELMQSVATRAKPEGGALSSVVERFVSGALAEARETGRPPAEVIHQKLHRLSEMVGGYDFAEVIAAYWRGHDGGDETLKASAVRWLRGEFDTKTDARAALGVRTIVDDTNVYDHLKLFALFVRLSGFAGLVVELDELVNLFRLGSGKARRSNYEQILRVLNDCLQGTASGLGFLFGATPELVYDTRRGLYSYEALQSRLAQNRFATDGLVDLSGPVLGLENLSPEDVFVLLRKVRDVHHNDPSVAPRVPDAALGAFLDHCSKRVGDAYFRTPRNTIKAFVDLLEIVAQNDGVSWMDLLSRIELPPEVDGVAQVPPADENDDDGLATFKL